MLQSGWARYILMAIMYIPEEQVRGVLTYEALIPAIREALIDYSAAKVEQPDRTILRAGNAEGVNNGWFALMPALYGDAMAVKNAALGLPTHMAIVELLRRSTGEPLAVMDGRLITEMRTAAVSAVAFQALASPDAMTLGILGSGVQARAHIEALKVVWPRMRDIRVWSRNLIHAEKLVGKTGARAVSIEEAAASDVVLTATSSAKPVLEGRWLKPQALVLAVGATGATLRELDDAVMQSSTIIAESRSCVERESGDVRLSGAKIRAELGEILAGAVAAPRDKRVVFKSVGMAIEDLTAARLVWQGLNR